MGMRHRKKGKKEKGKTQRQKERKNVSEAEKFKK